MVFGFGRGRDEQGRHTEVQIIAALKQVEAGRTVEDVARECGGKRGDDLHLEGEFAGWTRRTATQQRTPAEFAKAFRVGAYGKDVGFAHVFPLALGYG
jgi:hypothetical protein